MENLWVIGENRMEEKKQGFFAQIDTINNTLKAKQGYITKFQEYDNSKRICMALIADGWDDYAETKNTIKDVQEKDFSLAPQKLAYQPIIINNKHQ